MQCTYLIKGIVSSSKIKSLQCNYNYIAALLRSLVPWIIRIDTCTTIKTCSQIILFQIQSKSEDQDDETFKSSLQALSFLLYVNSHPSLVSQSSIPAALRYVSDRMDQEVPSVAVEVANVCSIDPEILTYLGMDSDICNSVNPSSPGNIIINIVCRMHG